MKIKGPPDPSRVVVVNVDVQNAFGEEAQSDKLKTLRPTERDEVARAAALSDAVHAAGGAVIVTKDWHSKPGTRLPDGQIDDRAVEEFGIYGEHAIGGTRDAELNDRLESTVQKMEAREGQKRTVVPVDGYDRTGRAGASRIIEVHKNVYDVTKRVDVDGQTRPHANFLAALRGLEEKGYDTAIVTGKIAEVCVRAAASSIAELFPNMRVIVAEDAVSALPSELATAIGLDTKEKVMASLAASGVTVAQAASLLPSPARLADAIEGR